MFVGRGGAWELAPGWKATGTATGGGMVPVAKCTFGAPETRCDPALPCKVSRVSLI